MAVMLVAAVSCGSDESRPSDAAWGSVWEGWRDSIREPQLFIDRGEGMCDELLGRLHSSRQELLPTPTEGLDAAVRAWIDHAQSVAFDCPSQSPDLLRSRLHDIDVLAAEIDAGLATDQDDL